MDIAYMLKFDADHEHDGTGSAIIDSEVSRFDSDGKVCRTLFVVQNCAICGEVFVDEIDVASAERYHLRSLV